MHFQCQWADVVYLEVSRVILYQIWFNLHDSLRVCKYSYRSKYIRNCQHMAIIYTSNDYPSHGIGYRMIEIPCITW